MRSRPMRHSPSREGLETDVATSEVVLWPAGVLEHREDGTPMEKTAFYKSRPQLLMAPWRKSTFVMYGPTLRLTAVLSQWALGKMVLSQVMSEMHQKYPWLKLRAKAVHWRRKKYLCWRFSLDSRGFDPQHSISARWYRFIIRAFRRWRQEKQFKANTASKIK